MNKPQVLQSKFQRSRESIAALISADLQTLRLTVNAIHQEFHFPEKGAWIGTASKRQLLTEMFFVLTNNLS
jgi:hypothetical protein